MVNRIVGLASGMDIDSMVTKLMQAERVPLDKLTQKKQTLEWQRDDYRSMNALFLDFKNNLTNMKLTPQYRVRNTTSTNDSLVSVSASSGAGMSSYSISSVQQLASAARKVNAGAISSSSTDKVNLDGSLKDQASKLAATSITWKGEGAVESKSVTISDTNNINLGIDPSTSLITKGTTGVDSSLINVKVNGTSYQVITDPVTVQSDLQANQVFINSSGQMLFSANDANIKAGNAIQVDYVTNSKVDTSTLAKDTKEWQLSKTSISTFTSLTVGTDQYNLGNPTGTDTYELSGTAGTIGTINLSTGKITFNDNAITADNTSVKANYKEQYTNFNIQTATSKGTRNQNFLIEASDSLNNVISKVNNSSIGVSMFYDSFSDQLTMTRTESGNFNGDSQNILDASGNLITNSNYDPKSSGDQEIITSGTFIDNVLKFGGVAEAGGENALLNINGLQTERNSNNFQMNGVSFTLKQTFSSSSTSPVSVSVTNDVDKIYDNIKAIVDQYNTLIDTVNQKVSEERYRDYAPLSDDQRSNMTDTQQQQWDAKAKSGLLKGDSILTGALQQMRTLIYQPISNGSVSSKYNQLANIGITTSPDYTQGGKLEIDDTKLKQALQDDPESVENLFRGIGDTSSSQGIVNRLYDSVSGTIDQLNDRAGKSYYTNDSFTIGRDLNDVTDRITSLNDKLTQVENRYYAQFNAMDQAIQNANSQASYLASFFGGGK